MKAKIHGQIYLLGELHCEIDIMERQLELWCDFYHKKGIHYCIKNTVGNGVMHTVLEPTIYFGDVPCKCVLCSERSTSNEI